jgi:hypothetical protein
MKIRIIIVFLIAILLITAVWFIWGWTHVYDSKFQAAVKVIMELDTFFKNNSKYPDSLEVLGIEETLEGLIFYKKISDQEYEIWFGTTLGNSMVYNSKTKKWHEEG